MIDLYVIAEYPLLNIKYVTIYNICNVVLQKRFYESAVRFETSLFQCLRPCTSVLLNSWKGMLNFVRK